MPTATGTLQGTTIVLDDAFTALDGQRVRVTLEPLEPASSAGEPSANEGELAVDPPMARLIGRTILSTSPDGTVELQFDGSQQFTNRFGTIQGGMLAAMLDSSLGIAIFSLLDPGQRAVTVEMSTHYFRPAQPGPIRARASVLHKSSTLAHAQADLFDAAGVRLAHAVGSLRIAGAKADNA